MKLKAETLNDVLFQTAGKTPEKTVYRFLNYTPNDEIEETALTYREFEHKARRIAAYLQQFNAPGERALLLYLPSLDYIISFFGCLLAGIIAVPVYVPLSAKQLDKLKHIADNCGARFILAGDFIVNVAAAMEEFDAYFGHLQLVITDNIVEDDGPAYRDVKIKRESLAFLQYTSGSTANPRGVMVSHGNLLHNLAMISQMFQLEAMQDFHELSWLPPYHDMGLIGGILTPLYLNGCGTFMSPIDFLLKPLRWPKAVSTYRCNISGGPNFAYDLCAKKMTSGADTALDLSAWKVAFNGAEMIRSATLDAFYKTFKPYGFRKEAFYPCYGMAEATLLITGGDPKHLPVTVDLDSEQLSRHMAVTATDQAEVTRLVGCGIHPDSLEVRIVDPVTLEPCPENHIGEIWVTGPSIASGYWNQPEEYVEYTFRAKTAGGEGPYLRTGDLGFLKAGELFVTGRLKDLIIVRGRNIYPHDIEACIAEVHPACRPGCCSVFGVDIDGNEAVVAVQEIHKAYADKIDLNALGLEIQSNISAKHGIGLYKLVLIQHGSIPKTSSGKLQRNACKTAFQSGRLKVLEPVNRTASGRYPAGFHQNNYLPAARGGDARERETDPRFPKEKIRRWLIDYIIRKRDIRPSQIDIDAPLNRFVPSSLDVVILSGELERWLDRKVSPTLIYDFPTIALLSAKLAGNGGAAGAARKAANGLGGDSNAGRFQPQDIAIVGMGCRFPGGAETPGEFFTMLDSGADAVGEFPSQRGLAAPNKAAAKRDRSNSAVTYGGYIDNVDQFDAAFFNMFAREAKAADPQQRLLLETSWHALEDAGIKPSSLSESRTGVFIGIAGSDYARLYGKALAGTNIYSGIGNAASIAANRISYFYNFKGPSLAIDTACSSSLVAVHQGCAALCSGESDLALAGGVNIILDNDINFLLARAGMLSSDGRCKAFDKAADGYVRGEGCGMVVLKRLSDAVRDRDDIIAVIAGSAINQDGRSNGITAPNGRAQKALLNEALDKAAIAPDQIGFIEAHGTGTALGDPIEVNTLINTLMPGRSMKMPLFVGSVKTNIGHLEAAAGIAGLIKAVLCLKHGRIPANLHLKKINPHIEIGDTALRFPQKTEPFPKSGATAYAGVSSFSFGGTNAHIILKSFRRDDAKTSDRTSSIEAASPMRVLIALSARNEERLRHVAALLRDYINTARLNALPERSSVNLLDLAYSLQYHREAMPQRLAFVVSGSEELLQRLNDFCQGTKPSKGVFYGNVKHSNNRIKLMPYENAGGCRFRITSAGSDLERLAHLWTCGFNPDWKLLYRSLTPRKITLPPYPFERRRYWAGPADNPQPAPAGPSIHPLLGQMNMAASLGRGIVFENTLRPDTTLLADHSINGRRVMPRVGFMEIAAAAVAQIKLNQRVNIKDLKWCDSLMMSQRPVKLSTIITSQNETLSFKIISRVKGKKMVHAKGGYMLCKDEKVDGVDSLSIDQFMANIPYFMDHKQIYQTIEATGLRFSSDFRVVEEVRCRIDTGESLGILRNADDSGSDTAQPFRLPLLLIYGAFQTAGVSLSLPNNPGLKPLMQPHSVDRFELVRTPTETCYAYTRLTGNNIFDIIVFNDNNKVCLKIYGVVFHKYSDPFSSIIHLPCQRSHGGYLQGTADIPISVSASRRQT